MHITAIAAGLFYLLKIRKMQKHTRGIKRHKNTKNEFLMKKRCPEHLNKVFTLV